MSDADLWRPAASLATLRQRAAMRQCIREHFADNALEVEVPVTQGGPNRDHGVDPARLAGLPRWLTTSPEHPLKRLVAAGYGAVWCLHPCLRLAEHGRLHRSEFTMLEWYRPGCALPELIAETVTILQVLLSDSRPTQTLSWHQAMALVVPESLLLEGDAASLADYCPGAPADCDRSAILDLIFATQVQPRLGQEAITVVSPWPADACAQARIIQDSHGRPASARFEVFIDGVELANGYDECCDEEELRQRFDADARQRQQAAQHDERYLHALASGMPSCSGVAVGFDRLVLLACGLADVGDAMAFPWERA
ncbi:MAG: hypothetical protein EA401_03960 [Planctomycetota bacterium]|nr:MAG: hypothetical protein EA401_03960 [Planctomycetota bacterium]